MKSLEYKDRLIALSLWFLEERRNRSDLIEVLKILRGFSTPTMKDLFTVSTNLNTRGHTLKLAKNRCKLDLRKFFFSEIVISRWNKLDQMSIHSQTINQFKNNLQKLRRTRIGFFEDQGPISLLAS